MFNTITVPLDGSALSEAAIPFAVGMANTLGSSIQVLVVKEPEDRHSLHMFEGYARSIVESARQMSTAHVGVSEAKPVQVTPVVLSGSPATAILEHTETGNVDLIVMAAHGRSGVTNWALGSVADKVIRASQTPVMLVRVSEGDGLETKPRGFSRILVPLDTSRGSEVVLPLVEELGTRYSAEIHLVHTFEHEIVEYTHEGWVQLNKDKASSEHYIRDVADKLSARGISVQSKVMQKMGGTPGIANSIMWYADEIGADLVAMATHGRSGVSRWFLGSVTERVLRGGTTPLLIIRTPEKEEE